jgi:hypothetical protein
MRGRGVGLSDCASTVQLEWCQMQVTADLVRPLSRLGCCHHRRVRLDLTRLDLPRVCETKMRFG